MRVYTTTAERNPYLLQVGLRIKARRVIRQISQDRLSAETGISRVTLGSIERGEHAATLLTYQAIAHGLDVDTGDLLVERPD